MSNGCGIRVKICGVMSRSVVFSCLEVIPPRTYAPGLVISTPFVKPSVLSIIGVTGFQTVSVKATLQLDTKHVNCFPEGRLNNRSSTLSVRLASAKIGSVPFPPSNYG